MEERRNKLLWELIGSLNDRQDFGTKTYDCGPLGILQLWFTGAWEWRWINPIPLPKEFQREDKNEGKTSI